MATASTIERDPYGTYQFSGLIVTSAVAGSPLACGFTLTNIDSGLLFPAEYFAPPPIVVSGIVTDTNLNVLALLSTEGAAYRPGEYHFVTLQTDSPLDGSLAGETVWVWVGDDTELQGVSVGSNLTAVVQYQNDQIIASTLAKAVAVVQGTGVSPPISGGGSTGGTTGTGGTGGTGGNPPPPITPPQPTIPPPITNPGTFPSIPKELLLIGGGAALLVVAGLASAAAGRR